MKPGKLGRYAGVLLVLLLVNTAYIAAFASPTIFYMGNVVLHLALGLALAIVLLWFIRRMPLAGSLFLIAALAGVFLAVRGNTTPHRWVLEAHIAVAALALLAFLPYVLQPHRRALPQCLRGLPGACWSSSRPQPRFTAKSHPNPDDRIRNPSIVPVSMNEEGGGPQSPFFPSSAKTNVGGIIPSNFFMDSEACGRCHKDIYEQWKSSMHHFASFNNQFYRKSIEYMQSVVGTQPQQVVRGLSRSRGLLQWPLRPADQGPDRYAGSAGGLACMSCHAIAHVDSSMGNAGFTVRISAAA